MQKSTTVKQVESMDVLIASTENIGLLDHKHSKTIKI